MANEYDETYAKSVLNNLDLSALENAIKEKNLRIELFSSGGRVRVFNTIADSTLYAEGATVWESLETLAKCAKNPKHGSTIYATGGYPVSYFDEWVIQGRTTNIFYTFS